MNQNNDAFLNLQSTLKESFDLAVAQEKDIFIDELVDYLLSKRSSPREQKPERVEEGWPEQLDCDVCGVHFEPLKRVVKVRRAFCSDECKDTASGREYEKRRAQPKRTHEALEPEVKMSTAAVVARSEAQQLRRAQEQKPKHDCKQCGKLTRKLFCNDRCRKRYEKDIFLDEPEEVEIGNLGKNYDDYKMPDLSRFMPGLKQ